MSDTPERYQRIKSLFGEARELPAEEQAAYLTEACGGDDELRREIEELLAVDLEAEGDALDQALLDDGTQDPRERVALPREIAGYRIVGLCGTGGMGTVYEAEQTSPRRRVALKVIQSPAARGDLLRRFKREAEILARLQHPGIAQVYDAGEYESEGIVRPYFVMEFIDGVSITKYADRHALDVADRLQLFLDVCEAVHYAHESGVVHRDLKPDNVLVTEPPTGNGNGNGKSKRRSRPKILDFGVAHLTDAEKQATLATGTGQLLGSVPYMSPEQASAGREKIGHRTDLYSLGVLLFELLTGRLPYDVRKRSLPEAIHTILNGDPDRLSSVDPGLRGDLETIVGKCLEKEAERRYASVSTLAHDLELYLANKPITARPPSTWYQIAKFARRHRAIFGGIAATLCALAIGLVVSIVFAVEASRNAARAQRNEEAAARTAYRASLAAAAALQRTDPAAARRNLESVEEARRGWEWRHLWTRLQGRLIEFGAAGPVAHPDDARARIATFAEGRLVAGLTGDDTLSIWDVVTGTLREEIRCPQEVRAWDVDERGERLVAGLADGSVRARPLGGAGTWEVLVAGNDETVGALRVAPDGSSFAFVRGEELVLWKPDGPRKLRDVRLHRWYSKLSYSGDSRRLATICFETHLWPVQVWDTATCALVWHRSHTAYEGQRSVALDHDGALVAIGMEQRQIRVFHVEEDRQLYVLPGHQSEVRGVEFHENGDLLSHSRDDTVRVWDVSRELARVVYYVPELRGAVPAHDGHLVTLDADGLALWQVEDASARVLLGHDDYVYDLAFSPDSDLLASTALTKGVLLWDPLETEPLARIGTSDPTGPVFSADGELLGKPVWGQPRICSWPSGAWLGTPAPAAFHLAFDDALTSHGFSTEAPLGELGTWHVTHDSRPGAGSVRFNGTLLPAQEEPAARPRHAGAHPVLTIGYLNKTPNFGGELAELLVFLEDPSEDDAAALEQYLAARGRGEAAELPKLGVAPVVHLVASEEDVLHDERGYVTGWKDRARSGRVLVPTGYHEPSLVLLPADEGRPARVEAKAFYDERRLECPLPEAAGAERLTVFFLAAIVQGSWPRTPYAVGTVTPYYRDWEERGDARVTNNCVYGPNGDWYIEGDRKSFTRLTVRDVATGRRLRLLDGAYHSAAVHPDGRLACGMEDGRVAVYDTRTWEVVKHLDAHATRAFATAWSPDGARLATAGNDNLIRLWDAQTYDMLLELTEHTSYVKALRFSPDGTLLASASGDRTVRVWDSLSPAERHRERLERAALEDEVAERVVGMLAEAGGDKEAALAEVRAAWPERGPRRRAALRVLARLP